MLSLRCWYYFLSHLYLLSVLQCFECPSVLTSVPIGPVPLLPWRHRGGRIVGRWGCHSNPSEEKREGGDLALGHPHPSWPLSEALWQVSSYGGPAGQIDNSMSRPAPGFYMPHFTASVFVWQTPFTAQYPDRYHPQSLLFLSPSLFSFFPTTHPCFTTVLPLLCWFEMGNSSSSYKKQKVKLPERFLCRIYIQFKTKRGYVASATHPGWVWTTIKAESEKALILLYKYTSICLFYAYFQFVH